MFLFFPLFLSVFAAASSIDTIEESPFRLSILQTNCYDNIPIDISPLEFDTSLTDRRVISAMNVCDDDHLSLLKEALEDGVNFDVPCLPDKFPIHFAIEHERYEMFDLLVKKVDLNQRCILGLTPLHHALQEGNLYFIRELLRNGANPHERALVECVDPPIMGRSFIEQSFYKTPMTQEFITFMMNSFVKYWRSNDEIIKKAIFVKNEPLVLEMVKRSPFTSDDAILDIYCDTFEFPSVKEYLLSIDPEIEQKAEDFVRGLSIFDACQNGNLLAAKVFILTMNIDIEAKDRVGRTALHYASLSGHKEVVEFLLSNGSDIEAKDYFSFTNALHHASSNGHTNVVEFLLSKGSAIDAKDFYGRTALHYASSKGHRHVVKLLLSKGSAIKATDNLGGTALHFASYHGHENVVKLLLSKGSDIDTKDISGLTALHHASCYGHRQVVRILENHSKHLK